jgi:hypothetical protein
VDEIYLLFVHLNSAGFCGVCVAKTGIRADEFNFSVLLTYFLFFFRVQVFQSVQKTRVGYSTAFEYFCTGYIDIYTVIKFFGFLLPKHSGRKLLRKFRVQKRNFGVLNRNFGFSDQNFGFLNRNFRFSNRNFGIFEPKLRDF